jgi:hypothetical protein
MPTRQEYAEVVRQALAPHLVDATTVWRGVYQLLMWFHQDVPHIMDGDKLARGAWRRRAEAVKVAIAAEFGCDPSEVVNKVDLLVKSPIFAKRPQRQNPLGIGFVASLFTALEHFSSQEYRFFPEEAIGDAVFRGIREAPRSAPDIVAVKNEVEVAVLSAKWSLRHDRLKDLKDECNYFKTLMGSLKFYAVTNEFDPARLNKVLEDYRIDGLFHVNRRLVVDVAQVDSRLQRLADLSDLLGLFRC